MKKKKKNKKRKLRVFRVIKTFFVLCIVLLVIYLITLIPTRGYYVTNNNYYSDDEILDILKLNNKSSFLLTSQSSINSKVKKNEILKKVKLHKKLYLEFELEVLENKIMFYDLKNNKSVLEDGTKVNIKNKNYIVLTNEIKDKNIYKKLAKKMLKIDDDILDIISEIKYDPNEVDNERFLFSMNDGNYVYITLSKIKKINSYEKIVESIKDQKGILYLDYGNYFVPKE